jgi:hypothetical protein
MAENRFDAVQRELELTLTKLKAEKDPKRRELLREVSRLLGEGHRILETSTWLEMSGLRLSSK